MNNAELIKALQCASHFALYQDCYEKNCYANSGKGLYCNIPKLMADAADALEAAYEKIADCVAAIEALDDSNDAYIKENERLKNRIAELEAQMPKEGEWIATSAEVDGSRFTGERCSRCGWWKSMGIYHYCPNCGARMLKGDK